MVFCFPDYLTPNPRSRGERFPLILLNEGPGMKYEVSQVLIYIRLKLFPFILHNKSRMSEWYYFFKPMMFFIQFFKKLKILSFSNAKAFFLPHAYRNYFGN